MKTILRGSSAEAYFSMFTSALHVLRHNVKLLKHPNIASVLHAIEVLVDLPVPGASIEG